MTVSTAAQTNTPAIWRVGAERVLTLDRPRVMGILNVTPDSFSDGGLHVDPARAADAALRMIDEGADIIDIGGESTRPGAMRIDAEEQKRRVLPVLERLRAQVETPLSIDTTLSVVAKAALDVGADIINDVSAGRDDETIFALAAERQCGLVLMHRRVRPENDSFSNAYRSEDAPTYDDVVSEVSAFLQQRAAAAERAGARRECICIDPGLGFGKTVEQNYELIARIGELCAISWGYPILCAASRKSFIGAATGVEDASKRIVGSVAVSVACWLKGVRLFRVHDVAAHREALQVAAAIRA